MKFLAITLIVHALRGDRGEGSTRSRGGPGESAPPGKTALLAEEPGFDGFGVGERHERPFYGHDPADAVVGEGTAGYYATPRSQDALAVYRPVYDAQRAFQVRLGLQPAFGDLDDFVARSSALIGSPQQVIEKVHRDHEQFGHSVLHLHADAGGLTDAQHRESLELFQSDIAPVLRREIPDPLWPAPAVLMEV
ncbi:MAG TPA: hypothetical protein VN969_17850 [Streptosporangiaceae bacterium]|jgi:hypothetical protein|nr:hypothetical protein [Streptosporangiaceae bacterium]